jgi:hypothetical protein
MKRKLGKEPDMKRLWHGFRNAKSEDITDGEEGFDSRYSRDGAFGIGVYFAIKASYSCGVSYRKAEADGTFSIFQAFVLVGDPCNNVG